MNLYTAIQAALPATLDAPAILGESGTYTWRDLERGTAMLANLLQSLALRPVGKGANKRPPVVAAHVDKSVEALMLYLATLRAGCTFLPLNPAYKAAELDYFVLDAQPAVLVCRSADLDWVSPLAGHRGVDHLLTLNTDRTGSLLVHAAQQPDQHEVVACKPSDLAAILYTSGTTGRSKGAMLSHGNLLSNARTLLRHWDWRQDDCLVHALPIFHIHGLFVASHCALLSATPMRWIDKFDADAVMDAIEDHADPRATVFMGVPTMYGRLLASERLNARSTAHMRLFVSGSAPLLISAFDEFAHRTGHTILERYGMSETGMLCSNPCRTLDGQRLSGSVGPGLPGVGVRIIDDEGQPCPIDGVGQVQVRGPNVFQGYLGMPEKTAESFTPDGWFITGDVGRIDAEGYVHLVGRAKDLIITGGFNVYPAEVEGHLDKLPGVVESAVVGVPHADFGEGVLGIVVTAGGKPLSEAALIQQLKLTIAGFKVPKRLIFVDDLPRNAMGKVQKNMLRQRHADALSPAPTGDPA
jgi:malonyl-CoA/methylmalonyl-CoA synthetase